MQARGLAAFQWQFKAQLKKVYILKKWEHFDYIDYVYSSTVTEDFQDAKTAVESQVQDHNWLIYFDL